MMFCASEENSTKLTSLLETYVLWVNPLQKLFKHGSFIFEDFIGVSVKYKLNHHFELVGSFYHGNLVALFSLYKGLFKFRRNGDLAFQRLKGKLKTTVVYRDFNRVNSLG